MSRGLISAHQGGWLTIKERSGLGKTGHSQMTISLTRLINIYILLKSLNVKTHTTHKTTTWVRSQQPFLLDK